MMFRWTPGRQHTGYDIFCLLKSQWLRADCYLLRYHENASIPVHTDPAPEGCRHYRLNVVLRQAEGGHFVAIQPVIWSWRNRIVLFRPDITQHAVTRVRSGIRYVFSIGWLRG